MTFRPIKATNDPLNAKGLARAVKNTLNAVAKGAKADFGVTVRTWSERPEFTIESPEADRRVVTTTNKVYGLVDRGTRPHIIRPRKGGRLTWMGTAYRAKTQPGQIKSVRGGNNNTIVYTKLVQHPGTEARKFTITIRDKWAKQMQIQMLAALAGAMKDHIAKSSLANERSSQPTAAWDWGHA